MFKKVLILSASAALPAPARHMILFQHYCSLNRIRVIQIPCSLSVIYYNQRVFYGVVSSEPGTGIFILYSTKTLEAAFANLCLLQKPEKSSDTPQSAPGAHLVPSINV